MWVLLILEPVRLLGACKPGSRARMDSRTGVNWNPHSLLQISPTPTLVPSTQLPLVYSSYMYPPRSEERDSEKDAFKLDLFSTETGISMVTGELLLPPDWLEQKSVCI